MAQPPGIHTIDYEKHTLEQFLAKLRENEIEVLFDIRFTPNSHRRGFSKNKLAAELSASGIEYFHERALGNLQENRAAFQEGDLELGRRRLRERIEEIGHEALEAERTRTVS